MNPILGWVLAAALLAMAWRSYGWPGVFLAVTAIVFWLLLQFNRTLRGMKNAGQAPVGSVASAVMLNARLRPGLTMLQVIGLTKSLGRRLDAGDDDWAWQDEGGSIVRVHFARGRLERFVLERPATDAGDADAGASAGRPPPAP